MSTVYSERIWISWWISLLFFLLIGFLSASLFIQAILDIPIGTKPAPNEILLVFIILLSLIYLCFSRLQIEIDSNRIKVKYGVVEMKILIRDVVSCETTTSRFRVYAGVGIRFGTDGSLGFTTSFGSAVKIIRKSGRPFVVSTKKSEDVANIINQLAKQNLQ